MTVETDRRPFSSPSVLIVPVNTVHGFDYGMDWDGWVLTVAEPCLPMLAECITIHAIPAWINAGNVVS